MVFLMPFVYCGLSSSVPPISNSLPVENELYSRSSSFSATSSMYLSLISLILHSKKNFCLGTLLTPCWFCFYVSCLVLKPLLLLSTLSHLLKFKLVGYQICLLFCWVSWIQGGIHYIFHWVAIEISTLALVLDWKSLSK